MQSPLVDTTIGAFPVYGLSWPRCPPAGAFVFEGELRGLAPRPEIFMTESNEWHNPSEDYPPSRPGIKMFLGAAVVCVVGAVIVNWVAISAFAHVPEIKASLGF